LDQTSRITDMISMITSATARPTQGVDWLTVTEVARRDPLPDVLRQVGDVLAQPPGQAADESVGELLGRGGREAARLDAASQIADLEQRRLRVDGRVERAVEGDDVVR
jgi:hypothetical protein